MKFYTVINCIDGRVQLPVIKHLKEKFSVDYIDSITEPGPNLILAEQKDRFLIENILKKINISLEKHLSIGIAIVGHYDCAANPHKKEDQNSHTKKAIDFLKQTYKDTDIIGLWVDKNWQVKNII